MLRDNFSEKVRQTLQRHDVQDEKLEVVLTDLFHEFERRLLSDDFIREISEKQVRRIERQRRARGLR